MATGVRKPGDFCWINMLTPNPPAACEFFGPVLGWAFTEIPGMGFSIQVGGQDVGGMFDLHGPNTPAGTPPLIGVMVKVENAEAACAKVRELGGRARTPFDIGDRLRMAVCHDPLGAEFDLWESKTAHGSELDRSVHGAPSWQELIVTDVGRARTFYEGLFGWTSRTMEMPGFQYTALSLGADPIAGIMPLLPAMGRIPPHWATYVTVRDADAVAAEAQRLGGSLCIRPHDIPGVGRMCGVTSPQGVTFHAITYTAQGA